MFKNLFCLRLLIVFCAIFMGVSPYTSVYGQYSTKKEIAPNTFLSENEKSGNLKLETSNEMVASYLIKSDAISAVIQRYGCTFKTDRLGRYGDYDFYFKAEDRAEAMTRIQEAIAQGGNIIKPNASVDTTIPEEMSKRRKRVF